ncbi:MAG TPA: BTAD domain-containing putative transcriptional regulator [Gammaproteobacteria bacterium]|nr:BTAD domain-containing putative transcriptional regulator [Gammaproteobacteria bacterium]
MTDEGLQVRLFGRLGLVTPEGAFHPVRGHASRALLVYLLAGPDRGAGRERLAALLWPDAPRAAALGRLRVALTHLEKQLAALRPGPYLQRDRYRIGLHPEAPLTSDWTSLDAATGRNPRSAMDIPSAAPLADIEPPGEEFEQWLETVRQRMEVAQLAFLERGARAALDDGALTRARALAERMVALVPWNETAHRLLAEALAGDDAPVAALAQLDGCRRTLRRQLDVAPEPATTALADTLRARARSGGAVHALQPALAPVPRDPGSWFPPAQRRKLLHYFAIFDDDRDGVITWDAFARKVAAFRDPFRIGYGDARLSALERAFADWWAELRPFARDEAGTAVDRHGWFRWFWWLQQRIDRESGDGVVPAAAYGSGMAIFRLADRDGDGLHTEADFCRWLSALAPHMDVDPPRAFRTVAGGRDTFSLADAMRAGQQFKFSTLPAEEDALFGIMEREGTSRTGPPA